MEATGHTSVVEVTVKPSGTQFTASRWLIHTLCSPGVSARRRDSPTRCSGAWPYSPTSVWPTEPPSLTAMICWP